VVTEADIALADGRTLHAYDTRAGGPDVAGSPVAVFWLHGSPNIGSPPEPLFAAAEANGLRWVSYDRPGYGGSSPHDGRSVASAAADVAAVADALGIGRFAVLGHSGGGPHALACAALRPERVIAAVSVSGPAPFDADGLDWFAGSSPGIAAENRAATGGRAALEAHWAQAQPEDMGAFFTEADPGGPGRQLVMAGRRGGPGHATGHRGIHRGHPARGPAMGLPAGGDQRSGPDHARCPDADHITVLDSAPDALAWLGARVRDVQAD
jgi:pimeloyl-ACP methyl ester carboxylesterase